MLPIALLPAAGILLRLGQPDLLGGIKTPVIGPFFEAMSAAGGAVFANLPLLFAIGVAIGFAKKADGSTALAAAAGYLVIEAVFKSMSPVVLDGVLDQAGEQAQINYSVFAGILVGLVTAVLFDRYHTIALPSYLGFFGGRRFVPIVVSVTSLVLGFGLSYFYPIFNAGLTGVGQFIGGAGAFGAFTYGFANRMLIPVGLHHILNTYVWFLFGDYQGPGGTVVTGELTRFAAGDTTAGLLTAGFYPILMFGLPAAALAMIHMADKKQKKIAVGILGAAAITAFLTGVTEPLEFAFMFVAFPLYVVHAVLTGLSLAIAYLLDIHLGFSFSAGLIDLLLYGTAPAAKNVWLLIVMGLVFFVVYYVLFRLVIRWWNLRTPGREPQRRVRGRAGRQPRGRARCPGSRRCSRCDATARRHQGRAADRRLRRPGEPGERRRVHHPAADGGRRQGQGRQGPPEGARRRRRDRGRQQRAGHLRHPGRAPQGRDHGRHGRSHPGRGGTAGAGRPRLR